MVISLGTQASGGRAHGRAPWSVDRLHANLLRIGPMAVAVSGGVDSVTLAVVAHRRVPDVQAFHAASPAVTPESTARVREWSEREGWRLTILDAGEFANEQYRKNPVDRCFHCKTQLYQAIRAHTGLPIVSGANLSDLGEYRPGLDAARDFGVVHPYIESAMDKAAVRALARGLELGAIAELPAAPCLSSRLETGIRVEPALLRFAHAVENLLTRELGAATVRCRLRASGIVVELDPQSLASMTREHEQTLGRQISSHALAPAGAAVRFEPYRNGSAFIHG